MKETHFLTIKIKCHDKQEEKTIIGYDLATVNVAFKGRT